MADMYQLIFTFDGGAQFEAQANAQEHKGIMKDWAVAATDQEAMPVIARPVSDGRGNLRFRTDKLIGIASVQL